MENTEINHGSEFGWELGVHFPVWANTEVYVKTVSRGYLLEGDTPKDAYWRVSTAIAKRLHKPELASKFFDYMWKSWLNLATPVFSNTGTERGLPISCFGIDVGDSVYEIGNKNLEMMLLAKHGGGVGIGVNQIRSAGSKISQNGTSDGIVPFCKIYDSSVLATNQGSVRRGAASVNLDIEHGDFWEWLEIREPKGDVNRQCLNLHQCVIISDEFMQKIEQGDKEARRRWTAVIRKRKATGEPYIMYKGNVNRQGPEAYKKNGLKVYMTNICVAGDTLINIQFENGDVDQVQISEIGSLLKLTQSIRVLSRNLEKGIDQWKLITDWGMTDDSAEIYEIEDVSTGKIVKCTGNHKFLTTRGWIEANHLVETDKLLIK